MKTIIDTSTKSHNIEQAYQNNKYIVTSRNVYQPHYSAAQGSYYATSVYQETSGTLCRSGRFFHFTGSEVNKIIGIEHLNNL